MIEWFWRQVAKLAVANRDRIMRRAFRTPYTHIGTDDDIYMMRYWLFNPYQPNSKKSWRQFLPSVRLHWICRPDRDRHHHDHPWNARTIILDGWYREHRDDEILHRRTGDTASIKFGEYHTISEVSEGGVWTLFITWKYRGTWGFDVDGVKVPYRIYLAEASGARAIADQYAQCRELIPPCKVDCPCQREADQRRKEVSDGTD